MNYTQLGDFLADIEHGGLWRRTWAKFRLWVSYGSVVNAEDNYTVWLKRQKVIKESKPTFKQIGAETGRYSGAVPNIREVESRPTYPEDTGAGLIEGIIVGSLIADAISDNSPSPDYSPTPEPSSDFSGGGDFGGGGSGSDW